MPATSTSWSSRRPSTRPCWGFWRSTPRADKRRGGLIPEVGAWIYGLPLHLDLLVKVRARGAASVAGMGDDLAALDLLLGGHVHAGQVTIERLDVVPVVDDQGDAVFGLGPREHHGTRGGRHDRGPPRCADVDPAVGFQRIVGPG